MIKAWSSSDGRLMATFRGHDKEISDIDLNYENTLMASGSCDKMIRIWNLRTTESTTVLQGHTSAVSNVEFSPYCAVAEPRSCDSATATTTRWLASSGNDGLICFWQWDVKTLAFKYFETELYFNFDVFVDGLRLILFRFRSRSLKARSRRNSSKRADPGVKCCACRSARADS